MFAIRITNGEVSQMIVGDPAWAQKNLGGEWVSYDEKVGLGWLWDGQTFTPPVVEEQAEVVE